MPHTPTFSSSEYARRVSRVKERMVGNGFDLLLCQDPANLYWLTGFDSWSFYTPQAIVLHVDDAWPYWFGRPQDAKSAHMTSILPATHIKTYAERLVHHTDEHPFDDLCRFMNDQGWSRSRIGVEMDAPYYTARAHHHICMGMPNARISDSAELVNWARLVKSPSELDVMRVAGRICSKAMRGALSMVVPGARQAEIIASIYADQAVGIDGDHGDYTSLCPLLQVGEGTSTPHLTWSSDRLPTEGLVVIELAGARRHYHACLTRTAHLGPVPAQVSDLAKTVIEGGDLFLESVRPGRTCEEVESVYRDVLDRQGYRKESRSGYSIGVGFPPDWGERTASLRPGDTTVLESGMCFHFQSGVWQDGLGAAISESIVVTDQGAERLCDVPRELFTVV